MATKKCNKCKEYKDASDFCYRSSSRDKLSHRCKDCSALYIKEWKNKNPEKVKRNRIKAYNMTCETYKSMFDRQNGLCAVCLTPELAIKAKTGTKMSLSIDHCHVTGKIRGLLCRNCNTALGRLKDSEELLLALLNYLRKSK